MSAGRCQRRMMMGRGADGGCGTEEKRCPVARVSSHFSQDPPETLARGKDSSAETYGVNLYEQARKTLTERSPFDTEDQAATERVSTLPVALAVSLSKHSDSRRKHKNSHADHGKKNIPCTATSVSVVSTDVWAETQEYFRPITLADIDHLIPKTLSARDPCFRIQIPPFCSVKESGDQISRAISIEETDPHLGQEASGAAPYCDQSKMELRQDPMDIDQVVTDNHSVRDRVTISDARMGEQKKSSSLSWLLGVKNRTLLTCERPNKKRRLLGSDAGLERILKLPPPEGCDLPRCDYCCCQGRLSASDQLLNCANCKVFVHQQCYGVNAVPTGMWLCSRCQQLEEIKDPSNASDEFQCLLCSKKGGALKPVAESSGSAKQRCKFVHLFCGVWMPELHVENVELMEPIMNIESIPETWKKLACNVCKLKGGVCLRCSNGTCRTSFHPMCAREAKYQMEVWGKFNSDNVELRVFCLKHSDVSLTPKSNFHDGERAPKEESKVPDVGNEKHAPDESSSGPMDYPVSKKLTESAKLNNHDVPQANKLKDNMKTSLLVSQDSSKEICDSDYLISIYLGGEKANGAAKIVPEQHNLEGWTAGEAMSAELCHDQKFARVAGKCCPRNKESSRSPQSDLISYIHPLISKRLFDRAGCYICYHKTSGPDGTEVESSDTAISFYLQENSAGDEVEGELVRLQSRLLDTYVAIKSHYGNLMVKLVRSIAEETCYVRNQRWDMILVNQFAREVREAKKRGRKEKRLREAQAILATAAAATASSRLSSIRKSSYDESVESFQEETDKVDPTSGSGGSNSSIGHLRRAKPSKLIASSLTKASDVNVASCDICQRIETPMNPIFICGGCKVAVHLDCYRRGRDPISSWFCELCVATRSPSTFNDCGERSVVTPACSLCGTCSGAFRKSIDGRWVHAFCAEWVLGTKYRRGQEQPVEGLDDILKTKGILNCCICSRSIGVTLKCCYGHCQAALHPICARNSGLYLNLKIVGGSILHRKAYCAKHSQDQRDKSNLEHIGVEELKNLKQIRVELEKLRLLCERIVKREKLKRECIICRQDILASRRDYMIFSVIMRSPLFSSGVSSESATTSVNNTSYSGTAERSDDVTVDSTVPRRSKAVLPLHIKIDRASDRSRSILPGAADRLSFAGKQLPQRPPSFNAAAIQERRFKPRRPSETLNEVVMTLDQTSLQNQRLPKGFAYAPMDFVSKPHDCHKPDG